MKIHQLSLFLENKPGQVLEVCRTLKDAGIDIRALSVADAQEFGILRLIVSDWRMAEKALNVSGNVLKITEVLAIEVPNRPGGVTELLTLLDRHQINIEYMYTHTFCIGDQAVMICRFDNIDSAIERLRGSELKMLEPLEIYLGEA